MVAPHNRGVATTSPATSIPEVTRPEGDLQAGLLPLPRGVHLVGSVPLLSDAREVFTVLSSTLGDRISHLPDGEVGRNIVLWQLPLFQQHSCFQQVPRSTSAFLPQTLAGLPCFGLQPDLRAALTFGELGYARVALKSYHIFRSLKEAGTIPAHVRFQVSLPTALNTITVLVAPDDWSHVAPAYQEAYRREVTQLIDAIPASDLALQWDVVAEIVLLEDATREGHFAAFSGDKATLFERLCALGESIPPEVHLGYHLCYGNLGRRHFHDPDSRLLVETANVLSKGLRRPLNWVHLPVPRWSQARNTTFTDADYRLYFEPLSSLHLRPETRLYLGLVHLDPDEDVDGATTATLQRIALARLHIADFGVATECGLKQHPPELLPDLLHLHRLVSGPAVAWRAEKAVGGHEW